MLSGSDGIDATAVPWRRTFAWRVRSAMTGPRFAGRRRPVSASRHVCRTDGITVVTEALYRDVRAGSPVQRIGARRPPGSESNTGKRTN
jgi:hypothetical protein